MSSFRRRLAFAGFVTAALALLVVLFLQGRILRADTREETRERLRAEARILAEALAPSWGGEGAGPWIDDLVDRAGRSTETRLTVIALSGSVLGDTTASGAALLAMENHSSRPEVQAALKLGEGTDYTLEAHFLTQVRGTYSSQRTDFAGDLYGQLVEVEFLERLRATQAFESPADLLRQISIDIESTVRIVRE